MNVLLAEKSWIGLGVYNAIKDFANVKFVEGNLFDEINRFKPNLFLSRDETPKIEKMVDFCIAYHDLTGLIDITNYNFRKTANELCYIGENYDRAYFIYRQLVKKKPFKIFGMTETNHKNYVGKLGYSAESVFRCCHCICTTPQEILLTKACNGIVITDLEHKLSDTFIKNGRIHLKKEVSLDYNIYEDNFHRFVGSFMEVINRQVAQKVIEKGNELVQQNKEKLIQYYGGMYVGSL